MSHDLSQDAKRCLHISMHMQKHRVLDTSDIAQLMHSKAHMRHLFSRRMAESKAPAAACWAARLPFCSHRCDADTPGVGTANTAASAACTGA